MATIVNARDVYLQAYTPRVEEVEMFDNVIVDVDQIEGLGLILSGVKYIKITASTQVFQIPEVGSVSPASVTINAVKSNITEAATISVVSGSVTPAPVLVDNSVTIPYSSFNTDAVTFRVSATSESVLYYDEITIIKVREGEDSFNAYLTNESHTVPADSAGNVVSYVGASGSFKVYKGQYDVTSACTFGLAPGGNPNGVVYAIDIEGDYEVTGGFPTGVSTTTLTFTATFGSTVLYKTFTLTKSVAGSNGADGEDGTDGEDGQRGSRTFYVPISGTTFDSALATTTASVDGGPVLNDVVTQYNSGAGFSETRFWEGSVWVVINAVVDGNLLVTGTVGANKLSVNKLSAITASMGTLTVDEIITVGPGGEITSLDFVDGVSGFQLFGGASSYLKVNSGYIGGHTIDADGIESPGYSATAGYRFDSNGGKIYARDIDIRNSTNTRIFDLSATGVEPILFIDDVVEILADGSMTIQAVDVIDTLNVKQNAISAQQVYTYNTVTAVADYSYVTITTTPTYTLTGLYTVAVNISLESIDRDSVAGVALFVNGVEAVFNQCGVDTGGANSKWWLPATIVYTGNVPVSGEVSFAVKAKSMVAVDGSPGEFQVNSITLTMNNSKR